MSRRFAGYSGSTTVTSRAPTLEARSSSVSTRSSRSAVSLSPALSVLRPSTAAGDFSSIRPASSSSSPPGRIASRAMSDQSTPLFPTRIAHRARRRRCASVTFISPAPVPIANICSP